MTTTKLLALSLLFLFLSSFSSPLPLGASASCYWLLTSVPPLPPIWRDARSMQRRHSPISVNRSQKSKSHRHSNNQSNTQSKSKSKSKSKRKDGKHESLVQLHRMHQAAGEMEDVPSESVHTSLIQTYLGLLCYESTSTSSDAQQHASSYSYISRSSFPPTDRCNVSSRKIRCGFPEQ